MTTAPIKLDEKAQDYINRVGEFAISNLKRKGVNKQEFKKIVAQEGFLKKAMEAYNEAFVKWSQRPDTCETLARMIHEDVNK